MENIGRPVNMRTNKTIKYDLKNKLRLFQLMGYIVIGQRGAHARSRVVAAPNGIPARAMVLSLAVFLVRAQSMKRKHV